MPVSMGTLIDERAARREQTLEVGEQRHRIDDVLEHLHAEHRVVRRRVLRPRRGR